MLSLTRSTGSETSGASTIVYHITYTDGCRVCKRHAIVHTEYMYVTLYDSSDRQRVFGGGRACQQLPSSVGTLDAAVSGPQSSLHLKQFMAMLMYACSPISIAFLLHLMNCN
jgi:hypothetical protein